MNGMAVDVAQQKRSKYYASTFSNIQIQMYVIQNEN